MELRGRRRANKPQSGLFSRHYYNGLSRSEEAPFFMVKELKEGFLRDITGVYRDPEGYFVEDGDVEAFDAGFPPKEKATRGEIDI